MQNSSKKTFHIINNTSFIWRSLHNNVIPHSTPVPLPPTERKLSGIVTQQLLNTRANNPVTIYLLINHRRKHGRRESLLGQTAIMRGNEEHIFI